MDEEGKDKKGTTYKVDRSPICSEETTVKRSFLSPTYLPTVFLVILIG